MIEQLWQNGAVTVRAGSELHCPDLRRGGVHRPMHLAPLASTLDAVRSARPFAITGELDPGAVRKQLQVAIGAPMRDLDGQRLLPSAQGSAIGLRPVQACHLEQASHHPRDLPERQLEQAFMVRQNWIAASENTAGRAGLPSCGASQVMFLFNQMSSDSSWPSEAVQRDRFVVP